MKQYELWIGSRVVIITEHSARRFEARLYVNNGDTATLTAWRGKTKAGAERWAAQFGRAWSPWDAR